MKKYLFFMVFFIPMIAFGKEAQWHKCAEKGVIVREYGGLKKNMFFFCEKAIKRGDKCDDVTYRLQHEESAKIFYDAQKLKTPEYEYVDGKNYYCCDGKWKEAPEKTEEKVTVQLSNGTTCSYDKIIDGCGREISTPCTSPDPCAFGLISRGNGVCQEPCTEGYAFENESSGRCIDCLTTEYSGINDKSVCEQCNPASQLWDSYLHKCVSKSERVSYTKQDLYDCYKCPGSINFQKCVTGQGLDSVTKKACGIDETKSKKVSSFSAISQSKSDLAEKKSSVLSDMKQSTNQSYEKK